MLSSRTRGLAAAAEYLAQPADRLQRCPLHRVLQRQTNVRSRRFHAQRSRKVGLWTKADRVTLFDEMTYEVAVSTNGPRFEDERELPVLLIAIAISKQTSCGDGGCRRRPPPTASRGNAGFFGS